MAFPRTILLEHGSLPSFRYNLLMEDTPPLPNNQYESLYRARLTKRLGLDFVFHSSFWSALKSLGCSGTVAKYLRVLTRFHFFLFIFCFTHRCHMGFQRTRLAKSILPRISKLVHTFIGAVLKQDPDRAPIIAAVVLRLSGGQTDLKIRGIQVNKL